MTQLFVHVGMPHCGDQALQSTLARTAVLRRGDGSVLRLATIAAGGELLTGAALQQRWREEGPVAAASVPATALHELDAAAFGALANRIANLRADGGALMLSSVAWGWQAELFARGRYLERLGGDAVVLIGVRPQLEWLNAAWWQLGAWSGTPLPRWTLERLAMLDWSARVAAWEHVPGVREVRVGLHGPEWPRDMLAACGVSAMPDIAGDGGLPGSLLRVLQRHPRLVTGTSPDHTALAALGGLGREQDWVLPLPLMRRVVRASRAGNEALLARLDSAAQQAMRGDARWWRADAYADRPGAAPGRVPAQARDSDRVAAAAVQAVLALAAENRALRAQADAGRGGGCPFHRAAHRCLAWLARWRGARA